MDSIRKILVVVFLLSGHIVFSQSYQHMFFLPGYSDDKGDSDCAGLDISKIDWVYTNNATTPPCVVTKATASVGAITETFAVLLSTGEFSSTMGCPVAAPGDIISFVLTIKDPGGPLDGKKATWQGAMINGGGEDVYLEWDVVVPTITVTGVTFCQGEVGKTVTATVTDAPPGYSIDWGNANITTGSSSTVGVVGTGLAAGSYNLTAKLKDAAGNVIKDKSGNDIKANYTVKVNPKPMVTITTTPANGEVCVGSALKLTANVSGATGNPTYKWVYTGTTGVNNKELTFSSVSPTFPTNYRLSVSVAGCESAEVSKSITINQKPTATLAVDKDSKCANTTVTLTAGASGGSGSGYNYMWTPNTLSGTTPKPTLAKGNNSYSVKVRDSNGCESDAVTKSVTGYTVTTTLSANPTSVPSGGTSNLTASASGGVAPYTYTWDEFAGVTGNTATASDIQNATTYSVKATDSDGCESEAKATVTVNVTSGPLAVSPKNKEICSALLPAELDAGASGGSGTYTYQWTAPTGVQLSSTSAQKPSVSPSSTPGEYDIPVEVEDASTHVKKTGTLHLKIKESPVLSGITATPSSLTTGGTSQLSVTVTPTTSDLSWSGGPLASNTGANVTTSPLSSDATYKVTATNDGCTAEKTVKVSVSGSSLTITPPANPPMGVPDTDIPVCVTVAGGNCNGNYDYEWKADAGVTVTPGADGCATVRATTLGKKQVCVKVTCGIESQEKCIDVVVADPNALTLNWTITEKVCQYPGEVRKINIMAVGGPAGAKYSFVLSAPDGSSALTIDKDVATSWEKEVTADRKGTYQLSKFSVLLPDGTTMDGVISPGQNIDADFYKVPAVYANGVVQNSTLEHCEGEELVLTGSGDATEYLWNNGVENGKPFVPTVAGTYEVTGTNEYKCSATDQVTVNLNPKPELSISVSGAEICPGEEVTLSATVNLGTVTWDNGVTDGAPIKIEVSGEHKFVATATDDATGCSVSKDTTIVVKEKPTIVRHSKNPRNIAIGKDVYFAVKATGTDPLSYEWYRKVNDEWSLLEDNSISLPTVSGATSDSLVLTTVPESWDGSELKVVVKNDCDTASMVFQLGVKECFEIGIDLVMFDGIIPDHDPDNRIDGWYCRGHQIALKAIITSEEGYEIENAHYKWTIDGLELPEEHVELESDTCILTWIPAFQEDDIVVKVCGYSDGACEEVCSRYLRLKAREFEKVSLSMLTSVDPDHRFCPGDTVDFWVAAKNVGDSARYEWYNDVFRLPEDKSPRNELLSYSDTKLTMVMGQEDTWMKVFVTPSKEVCTEEPKYVDTVFLKKGMWVTPSLRIINNIEDTVACRGDRILFTAVYENAGTNPTFNWRKDVWDWGHEQFAEAVLDDKDMWLKCWLVPGNDVCYDGSLLVDSMVIRVLENPTVVISADLTNKAPGDEVIVESEVTNMPTNAHYTWYLNNNYVLSNSDYPEYISDMLAQGDVIQCGVTGERICTSEVLSNELVIYFGDQSRDTMITIYQGEKIHNLNMRRKGDTGNSIFRITADGYPRWGVGSMNFNGHFDYTPNAGFVGSDVVKYEVVDKFDQTKVETGYIYISVLDRKRFFIPNIITPNGDGINDTWKLDFLAAYPNHRIKIYNRDGIVVFEATNYQNDWDGTGTTTSGYVSHFNLANGVYTYVIDLGNKEILKNWIEIRRDMSRGKYKY